MKRTVSEWIEEYMYDCKCRQLRPKTMQSYEQTLRLFERWIREEEGIEEVIQRLFGVPKEALTLGERLWGFRT